MQNLPPINKPKKSKSSYTDSFLEALRDLGSSASKNVSDQVGGFASDAWGQMTGIYPTNQSNPNQSDFPQYPDFGNQENPWQKNEQLRYKKQAFFERQKTAYEKVVFSKADQQTKMQIQSIQEELKKLAASTQNLAQEMQVAVMQAPVNPGVYHVSFFEKLRQTIIAIKKRIDQSASWLGAMNAKGKKQSYYWSQVGKSGTKYMLSQERYMQTSAG